MTEEKVHHLVEHIEMNPQATLKECQEIHEARFIEPVSKNTIRNWLDGQSFSLELVHQNPIGINSDENKELRAQYVTSLMAHRAEGATIVYIDETNFNLFSKRNLGEGAATNSTFSPLLIPHQPPEAGWKLSKVYEFSETSLNTENGS